jgi:hypothetical protein
MFVSSGNGVGCALFDITTDPPRELWRNKKLMTTMNGAVLWKAFLYGFNDSSFVCLSWETGDELWSTRDVYKGSVLLAGGKLILLGENGKLAVTEPNPKEYRALARAKIIDGRCWTTPVLSHGRLFVRNATGEAICLDLRN